MRTLLECYKILEEYPNGMTKDQFYRVARINKQHAKYLLDFGLVPCINTGKKSANGLLYRKERLLQTAPGQVCRRDYTLQFYRAGKNRAVYHVGKAHGWI